MPNQRIFHFSCHLEKLLAEALDKAGIEYTHESEVHGQNLDFYLPGPKLYIEVKQYHSDRIAKQLSTQDNVIVLQGRKSVEYYINQLNK